MKRREKIPDIPVRHYRHSGYASPWRIRGGGEKGNGNLKSSFFQRCNKGGGERGKERGDVLRVIASYVIGDDGGEGGADSTTDSPGGYKGEEGRGTAT